MSPYLGRSDIASEWEVSRTVSATIRWLPARFKVDDLQRRFHKSLGGIYIAEKGTTPVYVGETVSFQKRWRSRTSIFRELRLSKGILDRYRIRLGTIQIGGRRARGPGRQAVERVIVRTLLKRNHPLTNHQVKREFIVDTGGIRITNNGSRPPYLPARITAKAGDRFELDPAEAWRSSRHSRPSG